MSATLLDTSAMIAQQHIDELRQEASRERLARRARRLRRQRSRTAPGGKLRPATAR
jgi:hypothetical protein